MKRIALAMTFVTAGTLAQAEAYCLINLNGKTIQSYNTKSLCENRATNRRGWVCEKR